MNSEEKQAPPHPLEEARKRLVDAVARLERALEQGPSAAAGEAADIAALRSAADTVASRLDGAIGHLKNVLEK